MKSKLEVKKKKERNRTKLRKDRLYKLYLQWGDSILDKTALERVSNESEEIELMDLAPPRVFLIRKEKSKKTVNIDEIFFLLKSMYLIRNEEPRTFINDFFIEIHSFEAITNYQRRWKYELIWRMDLKSVKSIQKRRFIT